MVCSNCGEIGHNKRTCKSKVEPASLPAPPTVSIRRSAPSQEKMIDKVHKMILRRKDTRIHLLRNKEVISWLFGTLTFLPEIEKRNKTADTKEYKKLEDKWGQATLRTLRPDLKLDQQWTNKFGEHLCEELLILRGKTVSKPAIKDHYQPDYEVDDSIVEAKAQTYNTTGTAGEKILGCPFKYSEIPELYGKPLQILCIGGAEQICREQYGNLGTAKCSQQKKRFLEFFKENGIEYIGATDILRALV